MIIHSNIKDELCFSVNDYLIKLQQSEIGLAKVELVSAQQWIENPRPSALLKESKDQLIRYFRGELNKFDLALDLSAGTDFQQSVWQALIEIPFGEVITYKELAARVSRPKAARAVGSANGANPLPIIIPCHRVVATQGLGGYAYGLEMKKELLALEQLEF